MSMGYAFYTLSDELLTRLEAASYGELDCRDDDDEYEEDEDENEAVVEEPTQEPEEEQSFYDAYLSPFIHDHIPYAPYEMFATREWYWYQLFTLLAKERAGGASPFEEGCDIGFIRCSWSNNVKETAEALSQLTDDEIRKRYEQNIDKMKNYAGEPYPLEELTTLVHEVTAFYQRTAANGHALICRVV